MSQRGSRAFPTDLLVFASSSPVVPAPSVEEHEDEVRHATRCVESASHVACSDLACVIGVSLLRTVCPTLSETVGAA